MMNGLAAHRLLKTEGKKTRKVETDIRGWAFWRGIATPGYIRDRVNQLKAEVFSFAKAVSLEVDLLARTYGKDSISYIRADNFYKSMKPFLGEILQFWEDHQGTWNNFWNTSEDTIASYKQTLISFYEKFAGMSKDFSYPKPKPAETWGDPTFDDMGKSLKAGATDIWDAIKVVLYAGIIIVIFVIIF